MKLLRNFRVILPTRKELVEDLKRIFNQKFKPTTGFEGIVQGIFIDDNGNIYANGDFRRKTDMHPGGY
uniref:Beta-lactamase domain-containing protein n=1 Tax=Ascaris lumbricoides TaxID=6252 RepID=A0A0M3IJ45_ASCLU